MEDHHYDTAGCSPFLSQQDGEMFTAEALYMEVGSNDVVVGACYVVGPTVTSSTIDLDETPQKKKHHTGKMNRDEFIVEKRRRQKSLSKNLQTFLAKGEALHKTCGVQIHIKVVKENGDVIEKAFPQKQTRNVKLLVTLRFLAKGDFFSEVGDLHGVSRSSVSRHVWQVVAATDAKLHNINFPRTREEVSEVKRRFYRVAGLPNCLGAVDGTLVPILAPPGPDEPVYVCRKGYNALNIQAVTDANMRFRDVVARWPGSTHDAAVFQMCGLRQYLEDDNRGWLLGDSGYALRPYLMTPKNNPGSRQEEAYNLAHSQTRMVVERAFGLLKSRFRCLHKIGGCLPFSPEKCAKKFVVCTKLHNLCLNENIPLEGDLLNDLNGQDYQIVHDDIPTEC